MDEMRARGAGWLAARIQERDGADETGERQSIATSLAVAALLRAAPASHASVIHEGRNFLCRAQRPDGSLAGQETATWLLLAALQGSGDPAHRAALRRARRFIGMKRARLRIPEAGDEGLRQALRFLESVQPAIPAGQVESSPRDLELYALAGGAFEVREAYRLIQSRLDPAGPGIGGAVRYPFRGGILQEIHMAARVLSSYRSPRLAGGDGKMIFWPDVLLRQVRGLWDSSSGGWREAPGSPPGVIPTACALLALDALAPWTLVSEISLARAEREEPSGYARLRTNCAECHRRLNPGLLHQWEKSKHREARVDCHDCHGKNHSQMFREKGRVSAKTCGRCHEEQASEFAGSRHAAAEETLLQSALFAATPPAARESCFGCHRIGSTHADGSRGSCNFCHDGHQFSARAAREPEACTGCHTGEDYPQDIAYQTSKHGALYSISRDPMIAPTCATCHHPGGYHGDDFGITIGGSGSGGILAGTTPPIEMREISQGEFLDNRSAMVSVCATCHSSRFSQEHLHRADLIKREGNEFLAEAAEILRELHREGLVGLPRAGDGPGPEPVLGGRQVRIDPSGPGGEILNLFYDMWRFRYARSWKGAYHSSPSMANLQSRKGLARDLESLRALAGELRKERKAR